MRYRKDEYFDIMKDTLDNLAIKNQYKLQLYDEYLYYRLILDTEVDSYPEKAMTLILDTHCLKQLLSYYHDKEITKDDLIMFVSYITYNNIYTKCKEYLENAIDESDNYNDYVKALAKLWEKAENESNKIYLAHKDDLLLVYESIIETDLLDYPYFEDMH